MKKIVAVGAVLLFGSIAFAQTNVPKVGWDYLDADITLYSVTEFQISYDAGTFVSVGIPTDTTPISGGKSYWVPLNMAGNGVTNGAHTVQVRACNISFCSDSLGPLAFIKPGKGANIRIIGGK